MNFEGLSLNAIQAIKGSIASKGPYKGYVARSAPPANTLAYAARQAILMHVNPYKVSVGGIMFFSPEQKTVYQEIEAWLEKQPMREVIKLDKDRSELQALGVW